MDQPLVSTVVSIVVSNTIPPWYQIFKNSLYPITPLVSNFNFFVILQCANEIWILKLLYIPTYILTIIKIHKIYVDTIAYPFHILQLYIPHHIYTICKNDLTSICIWYQNFGTPYILVPVTYHKVAISTLK